MEETAAVLVGRQRVGRVGRDGMMGGRGLAIHGGQAAAQGATALHFHPVCQRYLVLNRLFVIHPRRRGGSGAGVWGHVFWGCRGEAVEVRAGVRRRSQRGDRSRAGGAAAGVSRASAVQAGLAEVADRPCVVVVGGGQGCFPGVKPRNTGAVDEVWSANLVPSKAS